MIFESPDGGKTVTVRAPHSLEKRKITPNPLDQQEIDLMKLWFQWREIIEAAADNPALKQALDRAQIIYELSRHDKN